MRDRQFVTPVLIRGGKAEKLTRVPFDERTINPLIELAREEDEDFEKQAFIDRMNRNLRLRRFVLLIIGDGIQEGEGWNFGLPIEFGDWLRRNMAFRHPGASRGPEAEQRKVAGCRLPPA
jgi:hypothetical protein